MMGGPKKTVPGSSVRDLLKGVSSDLCRVSSDLHLGDQKVTWKKLVAFVKFKFVGL